MPEIPDSFAAAVRRAYARPADQATAERHVAAIAEAARRSDGSPVASRAPARRRLWRPALAAAGAALALPAGLATAGVHLPAALTAPYDAVGVELPNQAADRAEERVRRAPGPPAATPPPAAAPAVPDGGVREGHGADDADRPGRRRSEERSHGRRGEERSRRDEAPRARDDAPPPKQRGSRGRRSEAPGRRDGETPAQRPPRRPRPQAPAPQAPRAPKPEAAPKTRDVPRQQREVPAAPPRQDPLPPAPAGPAAEKPGRGPVPPE